jgi:hypothetical protein
MSTIQAFFFIGIYFFLSYGSHMEQPYLLCTALALNIELLSNIVCAVYRRHIRILNI